jgi:hypothetical protein
MHEKIKAIIPESLRGSSIEELFSNNITYILEAPKSHYEELYTLDEELHAFRPYYNDWQRLRERRDGKGIAFPSIESPSDHYPLGIALNINPGEHETELERFFIMRSLTTDSHITISKIDNAVYQEKQRRAQEDFFNSLFEE